MTDTTQVRPERPPLEVKRRRGWRAIEPLVVGAIALAGILFLLFWRLILVVIPAGHVGVLYSLLSGGTVLGLVIPEGLALKLPWNTIYVLETRVQSLPLDVEVLSLEGLRIGVQATVVFHLDPKQADRLIKEIGLDYVDRLVQPISHGAIRKAIAQHDTHRLYTLDSEALGRQLIDTIRGERKIDLVTIDNVIVRTVVLPDNMNQAIQEKLTQEQYAASYEFILSRERSEAERKRIEAIGYQNYYATISGALSKDVLTWAGIQATLGLARSNNAKVVVVGGGQNQMPLILGSDIMSGAARPPNPTTLSPDANKFVLPAPSTPTLDPTQPPTSLAVPGGAGGDETPGAPIQDAPPLPSRPPAEVSPRPD